MARERDEHLKWAKDRAAEYLAIGAAGDAWTSFCSDMTKHPETAKHDGLHLGTLLNSTGLLSTVVEVREFIRGFN